MKYCKTCVAKCTGAGGEGYTPNCTTYVQEEKKKMTNADRIRSMTDEELAKFIDAVKCCFLYGDECGYPYCHSMKGDYCNGIAEKTNMNHLAWLQSEAE